ncbi:MAG: hypothetical protein R3B57_14315 [Phycisphaerales bacterium]
MSTRHAATLACLALGATIAHAQPDYTIVDLILQEQLVPGPGASGNKAWDIDATPDGSRLVVGVTGAIVPGCTPVQPSLQGAILIYDYDPGQDVYTLNDSIKVCGWLGFGRDLSISDDGATIIVGNQISGAQNDGHAWIYREVAGSWTLDAELDPQDPLNGFGEAVDIDSTGSFAAVTDVRQGDSFLYTFRKVADVWTADLPIAYSGGEFGYAVALDGDWLAVAVRGVGVRVYHSNGASWAFSQEILLPVIGTEGDDTNDFIEMDDGAMIVAHTGFAGSDGFMHIYELNTGTNQWDDVFSTTQPFALGFGNHVDIEGDRAIVGLELAHQAYVYERDGGGQWSHTQTLLLPNSSVELGDSVTIGADRYFVGGKYTINTNRAIVEVFGPPTPLCSFTEDFDDVSELPRTLFHLENPCATLTFEGGQAVLTFPPGCATGNSVRNKLGRYLQGDFDVSIDWSVDALPATLSGPVATPADITCLDLNNVLVARLERLRNVGEACGVGNDYLKAWDQVHGPAGCDASLVASTDLSGSMRLARVGTTWTWYYKDAAHPNWTTLRTATLTDEPVYFYFDQFLSGYSTGMTSRFDNLSVTSSISCPCNPADLASPFDQLDFSDVIAFLTAFGTLDPAADLALPFDQWDFSDVVSFLTSFGGGCPD